MTKETKDKRADPKKNKKLTLQIKCTQSANKRYLRLTIVILKNVFLQIC